MPSSAASAPGWRPPWAFVTHLSGEMDDSNALPRLHSRLALPMTPKGCLAELRGRAAEPFRRRLSDQQLVDLLKLPLCVGPARRAILNQLEAHHQRKFAGRWEFVRYAEVQKLNLDFSTTPQRR